MIINSQQQSDANKAYFQAYIEKAYSQTKPQFIDNINKASNLVYGYTYRVNQNSVDKKPYSSLKTILLIN